jgi:uncharacterized protein (DUF58 family)
VRSALATGLLALALAAAAAVFDAEPLWVPAVALALLGAGAPAWVRLGARGVRIERTLGARRVMEGEPLDVVLDVRAGRLPLPTGRILDPLLPEPAPLPAGRRAARVRIEARFARRGRRRLALTQVVVADPLGLAEREVAAVAADGHDEVLVLPRVEPVRPPGGGGAGAHIARGRPAVGAEVELDGVRPLRAGTPASRIFWPSIARGAEPQERRLSADGDSRPVVVLDPRAPASEEDLDAAVRAAASLAHHLALAGGCGVLLPGDRRATALGPTLAGWAHLHARLALVGAGAGPALGAVAHRGGPVVYVSARARARLPQALGGGRGAARVLVVPRALPGRAAFTVAGCHGYALGAPGRRAGARAARAPRGAP